MRVRSRRLWLALTAATVATLLGGCQHAASPSGGPPSGPPATTTAPTTTAPAGGPAAGADTSGACGLVTAADVSTSIGITMTPRAASVYDCVFTETADQSLQLIVHVFADRTNMENMIAQLASISETVDGLGDQAFWNGITGTMFVRSGERGFTISSTALLATSAGDIDGPKAGMVALATIALSHF